MHPLKLRCKLFLARCGIRAIHHAIPTVAISQIGIINNALNEVCNGIDLEGEFDTRMGCTVAEARELLAKIHALAAGQ